MQLDFNKDIDNIPLDTNILLLFKDGSINSGLKGRVGNRFGVIPIGITTTNEGESFFASEPIAYIKLEDIRYTLDINMENIEYRIKVYTEKHENTYYYPQYKSRFFGWCYFYKNFLRKRFYREDSAYEFINKEKIGNNTEYIYIE